MPPGGNPPPQGVTCMNIHCKGAPALRASCAFLLLPAACFACRSTRICAMKAGARINTALVWASASWASFACLFPYRVQASLENTEGIAG